MSERYGSPRSLQILAVEKVAWAAAIAAAEALDGQKMLSHHLCYAAFQIARCPGYEHLHQTRSGEQVVYMPPAGVSGSLQYLYMPVHPLAASWPPGRAGIGIVSTGKIDLAQGPYADLLPLFQGEDDGVDSRLITAISHMNLFTIIAI